MSHAAYHDFAQRILDRAHIAGKDILRVGSSDLDSTFRLIAKAYNALEKQTVHDQLAASGIAILEKNDVQNLTGMLETIFEERASFDFFIGFADNVEDDLGIIESVELTGQLSGGITGDIIVGPTVIGG